MKLLLEILWSSSLHTYDLLIVACFDARKYFVNQNPLNDLQVSLNIIQHLENYRANRVLLISTVDVYEDKQGDELSSLSINSAGYGFNRLACELLLKSLFPGSFVVRLQGLVGFTIKKNYLYDIKHSNNVELINRALCIQYYPLDRIYADLCTVIENDWKLVNLSCSPLSWNQIETNILQALPRLTLPTVSDHAMKDYNVKSIYKPGGYWVEKDEILNSISQYFAAE